MVSVVLQYNTNDFSFLEANLKQCSKFSDEILITICTHLFNGDEENQELIEKSKDIISKFEKAKIITIPYDKENYHVPVYYHNLSRYTGMSQSKNDWVFFLDTDEIVDDEFKEWFELHKHEDVCFNFTCNWYFREPTIQSTKIESAGVLLKKYHCKDWDLNNPLEAKQFYQNLFNTDRLVHGDMYQPQHFPSYKEYLTKINHISSLSGKPMVHHFSWVRSKEQMINKVKNWSHKDDKNWTDLVEEEFSRPFNGTDFIHNYEYKIVENKFNIVMNNNETKHFITFGNDLFEKQRQKLVKQAIDTGWFDSVIEETPDTIYDFYLQHKSFIDNNKRGYGYWIWKPYIILRQLEKMNDGDFLFYTDSGATILPHRKNKFDAYINLLNQSNTPVLSFGLQSITERQFQKMSVLKEFGLDKNEEFLNSNQVESGIVICKKTDYTIKFMKKWLDLVLQDNYRLVVDYDDEEQLDGYIGHRHDQSLLSVLSKTENAHTIIDVNEAYGLGPFFSSRITDDGPRKFAPDSFRMRPEYDRDIHNVWDDWAKWVNEKYPNPIPTIGTAIVNGFHWVERLVNSVDYPVENFVIFNNNGKGELNKQLDALSKQHHPYIKKITVCHMPSNIGVSGAWNLIIKSYMSSPYWIITNHDIAFVPGLLEEMAQVASDPEVGMIHPYGGDFGDGSYDCFLIKDWVVQSHGLFDENCYPAYCEDVDYIMRVNLKKFKRVTQLSKIHLHGNGPADQYYTHGAQTKKTTPELNSRLDEINIANFDYMNRKWGVGWRKTNPWKYPLNRVGIPLGYTTYDLEFSRKKNLGF